MNPLMIASISASLLTGAAIFAAATPVSAQSDVKFSCATSQGVPATVVQTSRGNIPVIRWVSNAFGGEYPPEYRCQVVSPKFQQFHKDGKLNYLTTGFASGQPVVCVASVKGGPCTGILFTLKSGSDPWDTLTRLMNVRVQAGAGALNESTAGSTTDGDRYIDMNDFLSSAPTEAAAQLEVAPSESPKGMW